MKNISRASQERKESFLCFLPAINTSLNENSSLDRKAAEEQSIFRHYRVWLSVSFFKRDKNIFRV